MKVRETWGGLVVAVDSGVGTTIRYWFDVTDEGRLVICAIIHEENTTNARTYIERDEFTVPDGVRDALEANGYDADTIYTTDARPLD